MSADRGSYRARAQTRQKERETTERRMRRTFWIGLTVPAIACATTALIVGPGSLLGWLAVLAVAPAAAAGVAVVFMLRDRSPVRPGEEPT